MRLAETLRLNDPVGDGTKLRLAGRGIVFVLAGDVEGVLDSVRVSRDEPEEVREAWGERLTDRESDWDWEPDAVVETDADKLCDIVGASLSDWLAKKDCEVVCDSMDSEVFKLLHVGLMLGTVDLLERHFEKEAFAA